MKSEHKIQNEIRLALSNEGYTNFRANVGKVKMQDGRWFDTGLPTGHPDLYGFKPNGKIFYIEVKNDKGKLSEVQKAFSKVVLQPYGIIHGVARSKEEALKIVDEELCGYGYGISNTSILDRKKLEREEKYR